MGTTSHTFTSGAGWLWQCPAGVNSIIIECWGGGGGGDDGELDAAGSGGFGGGYAKTSLIPVVPGHIYGGRDPEDYSYISVGSGQPHGRISQGHLLVDGASAVMMGGIIVCQAATASPQYAIGDVIYAGGHWGYPEPTASGGGGGGGAGSTGAGGDGGTPTGGNGAAEGGKGGNGSYTYGTLIAATKGAALGGGGGGGRASPDSPGADGADGKIVFTWTTPANVLQNIISNA